MPCHQQSTSLHPLNSKLSGVSSSFAAPPQSQHLTCQQASVFFQPFAHSISLAWNAFAGLHLADHIHPARFPPWNLVSLPCPSLYYDSPIRALSISARRFPSRVVSYVWSRITFLFSNPLSCNTWYIKKNICKIIQTHLWDIVGSIPNHHNKASIKKSESLKFFDFSMHIKYMFTLYSTLFKSAKKSTYFN